MAHRGASAYAPENTLTAFEEAIRLEAKAIEFDLRMTADGVMVALHDETVDRTTSGTGKVAELTWDHVRQLGIPSLSESLAAIAPYARPVVDVKIELPWDELIATLLRFKLEKSVLIVSRETPWLAAIRKVSRDVPLGLAARHWHEKLPDFARGLDAEILLLHTEALGPSRVSAAAAQGLETWAWTLNEVSVIAASAAMGVTGIVTDRPDLIRTR
ncbi:MAG: hypothetical protein FWD53_07570 [Phycisphaerales bacterium]|nr:hypothetical protein [Phycisphaerales bacterium]